MPNASDDTFPILIGITGKRNFDADPTENDAIRARVRHRLAASFAYINETLPHAPKVLLTGGAFGTDLLAAEAALAAGNEWSVALVLPYAAASFEYDFILDENGPIYHPDHKTFRALLSAAKHGSGRRVIVREMPPLMTPAGYPASDEELNKTIGPHDAVLRREHYEQVGQYIAETAMLLIAVMRPDERPNLAQADGGTARVVATRRAGRPDALGSDVAARGGVVRDKWCDLLAPPGGHVWLIDPFDPADRRGPPISVLLPLLGGTVTEVFEGRPGLDMPKPREAHATLLRQARWAHGCLSDALDAVLNRLTRRARQPGAARLRESLHAARSFDDFERLQRKARDAPHAPGETATVSASIDDEADTTAYIARLRALIRGPQSHSRQKVDSALRRVACLFVVAILALEIYAKFYQDSPIPLLVYVLSLIVMAVIVFVTRMHLWQPRAEDYRAVSEMLRIQRAWWACGLRDRVDREHLQGVDAELARSRDAMRAVLGWTSLRANWKPEREHSPRWSIVRTVRPDERPDQPRSTKPLAEAKGAELARDWIGEQIRYFALEHERREQTIWKSETQTWLMFAMSGALAALVVLWLGDEVMETKMQVWFERLADNPAGGWFGHFAYLPWLALGVFAAALRLHLRELRGTAGVVATLLAGGLCAFGLAVVLHKVGGPLHSLVQHAVMEKEPGPLAAVLRPLAYIMTPEQMTERLAVVALVVLTAAAGAVHFHAEKRGWEAEAFAFRDALDKFERAERTFATLVDPVSGEPADANVARARELVRSLGVLAMRENEAWLKTHRERPLSPVVG
jgi:hypothetical protein